MRFSPYEAEEGKVYAIYSGYSINDVYIGDKDTTKFICEKLGIKPECMPPEYTCSGLPGRVCCIGRSWKDGKWYGWSHRAIRGFSIGDVVEEGDTTSLSGYIDSYKDKFPKTELPVGFVAETNNDCKRMAIAFAGAVS